MDRPQQNQETSVMSSPSSPSSLPPPVRLELFEEGASDACDMRKAIQDQRYLERRRRNNLAAKKSRDARKLREDQMALRVAVLEGENAVLRSQVAMLRDEAGVLQLFMIQKATATFNMAN